MGIAVRERAQESALMDVQKREFVCGELQPELQLPCGWEKCLDLKSGLIYFKDWNSGTLTYRDPRQLATQRIGLLSISVSAEGATSNASEGAGKKFKRMKPAEAPRRMTWGYNTTTITEGDSSATETATTTSLNMEEDQSLDLSLNLPGTSSRLVVTNSSQAESVCTMEKVRSALERSNWLRPAGSLDAKKRASPCLEGGNKLSDSLSTALSLLSSCPSSSRESNSPRLQRDSNASPSTSQCSSECFTSPSIMSHQGDDEEVQQQPRLRGDYSGTKSLQTQVNSSDTAAGATSSNSEVMVTVGCKSCLMYVMLSKSRPSCPKCGNTDVLLELPAPLPAKKQRVSGIDSVTSPTWSWCTA